MKRLLPLAISILFVTPSTFGSTTSEWQKRAELALVKIGKIGQSKSRSNSDLCNAFLEAAFVPHDKNQPGNNLFSSTKNGKIHRTLHLKSLIDPEDATAIAFVYDKEGHIPNSVSITRLAKGSILSMSTSSKNHWVINDGGCIWVVNTDVPTLTEVKPMPPSN